MSQKRQRPWQTSSVENSQDDCAGPSTSYDPDANLNEPACLSPAKKQNTYQLELSLFVKWYGLTGRTRVNQLILNPLETIDNLQGLSQRLVARAFSEANREAFTNSENYYRFTPAEECLSYPSDVIKTELKLVVTWDGWEYVIFNRELGSQQGQEEKNMLVSEVQFESSAMIVGHVGVRLHLVAYPIISVKKTFLDGIERELRTNPDFKGVLV
mmetsp:Transcript_12640/g.27332  ORF Transcript_12640/g.27332 Transcript_12640/m.27332 type:complete len:213 (+) Transcript_12640:242-880(+)|eukprot:CAMPEP_0202902736 /NCGR_PEP_ID=MMETSP1392-20130828/17024_1 /ASSEMBLY_ACC=CAM_ASM_000868 /TAXON_ID=225041 /ORGANISM="Chlamydomonas chlamydogama, Strain SAG 11-48b" /LENGTH=212 /DNA_ID=CAMNT_0049589543 /DNA_START=228 /DNA_END=866 /DNA_ORIENTATION=-